MKSTSRLRLFPDLSVMWEQICIFETKVIAEQTVYPSLLRQPQVMPGVPCNDD